MKKTIKLVRQNHLNPNMGDLRELRKKLEELINSRFNFDDDWNDVIKQIIEFQCEDGSFNLLDSYRIESDCRVEYCHEPTYICSALLIEALLKDKEVFAGNEDIILSKALHMCCARGLNGHGYDSMQGQIKAINYFAKCHIKEFLKVYPNICPEFTDMFNQIKEQYDKYVKEERFTGAWGEDYKEEIMKIHNYFNDIPLFVYGTLMKGQSNHNYLSDSNYIGDGTLLGYDMYNLGCYPGIIDGTGKVYGELYDVNDYKLKDIDYLEGEGSLYIRKLVKVSLLSGEFIDAWCYIYNHTVSNYQKMSGRYGHDDMVWYISYGSNMLEERLKYYILGGTCHFNNKTYVGCKDKTLFTESKAVIIRIICIILTIIRVHGKIALFHSWI